MKNKHNYAAIAAPGDACAQIVKTSACIAADEGSTLTVISAFLPSDIAAYLDFIDYLQELSHDCSAELAVLCSKTPALATLKYLKTNRFTCAVTGSGNDLYNIHDQINTLSEIILPRGLSVIQLPQLSDEQITTIDIQKASELTLLYAHKNMLFAR